MGSRQERNELIYQRYLEGASYYELSCEFDLNDAYVGRIVGEQKRIQKARDEAVRDALQGEVSHAEVESDPEMAREHEASSTQERNELIYQRHLEGATYYQLSCDFRLNSGYVRRIVGEQKRIHMARDEMVRDTLRGGASHAEVESDPEINGEYVSQIQKRRRDLMTQDQLSDQDGILAMSFFLEASTPMREIMADVGEEAEGIHEEVVFQGLDDLAASLADLIKSQPGMTLSEISEMTGYSPDFIYTLVPSAVRRLTVDDEPENARTVYSRIWSDEQILESIRHAATYRFPLTSKAFEELRRAGEIWAPSVPLVHQRFGGWRAACLEAGVEPGPTIRENYGSRWTDDDLLRFVGRYLADESSAGTGTEFESWLKTQDGAPSFPTMRNRLGNWNIMKGQTLTADWFPDMLQRDAA